MCSLYEHIQLGDCHGLKVKRSGLGGIDKLCLHCISECGIWLVGEEMSHASLCINSGRAGEIMVPVSMNCKIGTLL